MFGNTFEIVGLGKTVNDGVAGGALADYVRGEFAPADRASGLAALKGGGSSRRRIGGRIVRALRSRRQAAARARDEFGRVGHGVRRPLLPFEALERGLLHRAFP